MNNIDHYLNEGKNDTISIEISYDDSDKDNIDAGLNKYGILLKKVIGETAKIAGTKKDLTSFLTSKYYGIKPLAVTDEFPELA